MWCLNRQSIASPFAIPPRPLIPPPGGPPGGHFAFTPVHVVPLHCDSAVHFHLSLAGEARRSQTLRYIQKSSILHPQTRPGVAVGEDGSSSSSIRVYPRSFAVPFSSLPHGTSQPTAACETSSSPGSRAWPLQQARAMDCLALDQILSHFAEIVAKALSQAMPDIPHLTDHRIIKRCVGTLSRLRPGAALSGRIRVLLGYRFEGIHDRVFP